MLLATIIFATLDYGRVAKVQNQLSNAAREGASVAELNPTWVDRGCQSGTNVLDRTDRQDPGLSGGGTAPGYTVTVAKRLDDGSLQPYTGCGTASSGVTLSPGDRVVVTVTRDIDLYSPMAAVVVGQTLRVSRKVVVVVQG